MANKKGNKKGTGLKIFGIIVLILIIILIAIIGGTYWFVNNKLSKMQKIDIDEKELSVSTQAEENLSDYRNIALFGIDSRDSSLGKGNRSDCIIIASLNNKTKEVKLISVYLSLIHILDPKKSSDTSMYIELKSTIDTNELMLKYSKDEMCIRDRVSILP